MDEIERKLRMFYVLESKDRWEHLLIVADECEEKGDTELAEALRWFRSERFFPDVKCYGNIDKVVFADKDTNLARPLIVDFIRRYFAMNNAADRILGGVIFKPTD